MSCLNLRRLLPPKRVWKVFTTKLLLKLQRTKTIKKQRNPYLKPSKKHGSKSLSIRPTKFKIQHNNPQRLLHHHTSHCYFQKGVVPVVINQLYIDPTVTVVKGHVDPSCAAVERGDDAKQTCSTDSVTRSGEVYTSSCSESGKEGKSKDEDHGEVGKKNSCFEANKEAKSKDDEHTVVSADDMWESMMASPQMNGIDERAEEFIARFRAEMHRQEIQARRQQ